MKKILFCALLISIGCYLCFFAGLIAGGGV